VFNLGVLWFSLVAGLASSIIAFVMLRVTLKHPEGEPHMVEISKAIREGANAFLEEEGKKIALIAVIIAVILGALFDFRYGIAFLFGAFVSEMAGVVGMYAATRANVRVTNGARKGLFNAFSAAFSGGSVMGLAVAGFSLTGLSVLMLIFRKWFMYDEVSIHTTKYVFEGIKLFKVSDPNGLISVIKSVMLVSSYSFGASFIALFDRVGGGIYTKAADMSADLVGKVEAGIEEDDPRNPATIADNVGDNVGDVAGLGADILESYIASIVSAAITAVYIRLADHTLTSSQYLTLLTLPLLLASVGVIASIIGVIIVKTRKAKDAQKALSLGNVVTAILVLLFTFVVVLLLRENYQFKFTGVLFGDLHLRWRLLIAIASGLIAGVLISRFSEYYTSYDYKPVKVLAEKTQTGVAVNITSGLALGMKSTLLPVLTLVIAILVAYWAAGTYGIAIAALGMLSFVGYIVSVDSYGPVADNAGGIAQMAELDPEVRKITDRLDSVGNTTAAIGKGFAIGSAAFAALSLIVSYIWGTAKTADAVIMNPIVNLVNPYALVGIIIGGMLPHFFTSLLINGVADTAALMIDEIRRQFKEKPGILKGEDKPDYARCIAITAKGALARMVVPGLLAVVVPFIIGFLFGKSAVAGLLIGSLSSAIMIALYSANAGGAWDNAKKYIEQGHFGGKGTSTHAAAVIGDTVGDPLKDTVGPSMDILVKLMSVVSLVFGSTFPDQPFFLR